MVNNVVHLSFMHHWHHCRAVKLVTTTGCCWCSTVFFIFYHLECLFLAFYMLICPSLCLVFQVVPITFVTLLWNLLKMLRDLLASHEKSIHLMLYIIFKSSDYFLQLTMYFKFKTKVFFMLHTWRKLAAQSALQL